MMGPNYRDKSKYPDVMAIYDTARKIRRRQKIHNAVMWTLASVAYGAAVITLLIWLMSHTGE